MTKVRAPLTYDNALAKIAGLIGWDAMGTAVGQAGRTVRDWGDPGLERGCPIEAAELLDLAFQEAGGEGAPMLDTYMLRFDRARQLRFADQIAIARGACTLSRESSQAIEALVLLSLPGADELQRQNAIRILEDFLGEGKAVLSMILNPPPPPAPP